MPNSTVPAADEGLPGYGETTLFTRQTGFATYSAPSTTS
jgi:hypothetical protein